MSGELADYEEREEIAIAAGKAALAKAPWLSNRVVERTKGFFVELRSNDVVHPDWYKAEAVDGIGTKLFLAAWSGNHSMQPIDGVMMNANDLATLINAYPDTMMLYFACQENIERFYMGDIQSGFVEGLERIRIPDAPFDINMGKIETATLDEMISLGVPKVGWDVGISMVGYIAKSKVPNLDPKPGHYIVGVSSTGMHSNGYTGARHALFRSGVEPREEWGEYKGRFMPDDKPEMLQGRTIMEAMQVPTAAYLVEASTIGREFDNLDIYGVNITGNGFQNFNRAGEGVSFEITNPLPPLPIHEFLMQESKWDAETAYRKQNMGMGFAYVVPTLDIAEKIVGMINQAGENKAQTVGVVAVSKKPELVTRVHNPFGGSGIITLGDYAN